MSLSSPEIRKNEIEKHVHLRVCVCICLHMRNLMRKSQFNELSFAECREVESHFYLFLW